MKYILLVLMMIVMGLGCVEEPKHEEIPETTVPPETTLSPHAAGDYEVCSSNLCLNETTSFGIADNQVYLIVADMAGKDQNLNVTFTYADHNQTRHLTHKNATVLQEFSVDDYGWANISLGKYKTDEINETDYGNGTIISIHYYYDDNGIPMPCEWVLADKSCMKRTWEVIGSHTEEDFLPVPALKTKVVIDGKKIEQKQDGIPLPKDGILVMGFNVWHPLFGPGFSVESWVKKYNITICSKEGCVTKDPSWWNDSYDYKRPINCTFMTDGVPLVVNGSDGIQNLQGACGKQIIWTHCSGTGTALYYNNCTDYVVANDSNQLPMEIELGNASTSYLSTSVWADFNVTYHMNATSPHDSSPASINCSAGGDPQVAAGKIGNCVEYDAVGDYNLFNGVADLRLLDFTIDFWMYNDEDYDTRRTVFYFGQNVYANCVADSTGLGCTADTFGCASYDGTWRCADIPAADINASTWYHVTYLRVAGSNISLYVNGTFIANITIGTIPDPNINNVIGAYTTAADYLWDGKIDEFRIWGRALTDTEISQIYNNAIGTGGYGDLGVEETPSVATASIAGLSIHPALLYTETDATIYTLVEGSNATYRIEFYWEVDDVLVSSGNVTGVSNDSNTSIDTLAASNYGVGQTINASVKAYIDADTNSTTNSTQKTVLNRPVTIMAIGWNASAAYTNESLSCNVTANFGDNTTGSVEYFISNGTTVRYDGNSTVQNGTNSKIFNLSANIIYKWENWYCNVSAYDGTNWSHQHSYNSTNLSISNTAPVCSSTAQSITLGSTSNVTPGTCTDVDNRDTLTWGSNITAVMITAIFSTGNSSSFLNPYSTLVGTRNISLNCTDDTDTGQCPYILTVSNCSAVAVTTLEKERFILRTGGNI